MTTHTARGWQKLARLDTQKTLVLSRKPQTQAPQDKLSRERRERDFAERMRRQNAKRFDRYD